MLFTTPDNSQCPITRTNHGFPLAASWPSSGGAVRQSRRLRIPPRNITVILILHEFKQILNSLLVGNGHRSLQDNTAITLKKSQCIYAGPETTIDYSKPAQLKRPPKPANLVVTPQSGACSGVKAWGRLRNINFRRNQTNVPPSFLKMYSTSSFH